VLRGSLPDLLGGALPQARFLLLLRRGPDDPTPAASPKLINLIPEYGVATVIVEDQGCVIYRDTHPLSALIGQPLRDLLDARFPDEPQWAFCLVGPGVPDQPMFRPAPVDQGVTAVTPYRAGEAPPFQVRRVPDPPLPEGELAGFGVTAADGNLAAFVKVIVPSALFEEWARLRPLSTEVEEGGFLLGRAYADRQVKGTYVLELTAAPAARYTNASLLHVTFTGDSFEAVKQVLRESYPGLRLLGWYHTHLFAATEEMGLSSVDLTLHFTTFRLPWQLAGLINLDSGQRTLRFYVRRNNTMALCPYWVVDEHH
jgi:hypothetical protein